MIAESHAFMCQPIQFRRSHHRVSGATQRIPPMVVAQQQHDVGRTRTLGSSQRGR